MVDIDPNILRVALQHLINQGRVESLIEGAAGAVVLDRPEERPLLVFPVAGGLQVVVNEPLSLGMHREVPDLSSLALNADVHDIAPAVVVADLELAKLFSP